MSEIARRARISKAYLSQLEHGESSQPSYDVLGRLAVALGSSPDYLAGGSSGQTSGSAALPASLRAFADQSSLPEADVSMLAHIHYRGKLPRNAEDWAHIYETIKRTIR
jgi:transcriptional regulator with XRE-family HTH domain